MSSSAADGIPFVLRAGAVGSRGSLSPASVLVSQWGNAQTSNTGACSSCSGCLADCANSSGSISGNIPAKGYIATAAADGGGGGGAHPKQQYARSVSYQGHPAASTAAGHQTWSPTNCHLESLSLAAACGSRGSVSSCQSCNNQSVCCSGTCCYQTATSQASSSGGISSRTSCCATTLTSLPAEALAIIAFMLDKPERQALALSCTAGHRAVASTAATLVIPGSLLLPPAQAADSVLSLQPVQLPAAGLAAVAVVPEVSSQQQQSLAKGVNQLLQRYFGVTLLRVTGCSSCSGPYSCQQHHQQQVLVRMMLAWQQLQLWQQQQLHCLSEPQFEQQHQPTSYSLHSHRALSSISSSSYTGFAGTQQGLFSHLSAEAAHAVAINNNTGASTVAAAVGNSSSNAVGLVGLIYAIGSSMPYLVSLDLSGICMHTLTATGNSTCSTSSSAGLSSTSSLAGSTKGDSSTAGVLQLIGSKCSNLTTLVLPGRLWQGLGSAHIPGGVLSGSYATNKTTAGLDGLGLRDSVSKGFSSMADVKAVGLRQAVGMENLDGLLGLKGLKSLKIAGQAPPLEVYLQLGQLTQLQCLSINAANDVTVAASGVANEAGGAAVSGSSNSSSSGTVLGTALGHLKSLEQLSLFGLQDVTSAGLSHLAQLLHLSHLDLTDSVDLRVQSLAPLSGISGLRFLRIRRCKTLQAKARAALPEELQALKQLNGLVLDFDLHLRDVQVLSGMQQLTLLAASSFHCCVNPEFGLCLPSIKHLALHNLPETSRHATAALQPAVQPTGQHLQPVQYVLVGNPAVAQQPQQQYQAGHMGHMVHVGHAVQMLQAAHPVQQQQQQHAFVLPAVQGHQHSFNGLMHGVAAWHDNGQYQQPPAYYQQLQHMQYQQQQQQPPLLHPQYYQHVVQQQLRSQQLRQLLLSGHIGQQAQWGYQVHQQQQQQIPVAASAAIGAAAGFAAAVAAAAGATAPAQPATAAALAARRLPGYLAQLCPNLTKLLVGVVDSKAFAALEGHTALQKLVLGVNGVAAATAATAGAAGLLGRYSSNSNGGAHLLAPWHVGVGQHGSIRSTAMFDHANLQPSAWAPLLGLSQLQYVKLIDTAGVLLSNAVIPLLSLSNVTQLVMQRGGCVNDEQAWLLASFCKKLRKLRVEAAPELSDTGLSHLASLSHLTHLTLSSCPAVTSVGLQQLLMTNATIQAVQLVSCRGVSAAVAQQLQEQVIRNTGRRVSVDWRSCPAKGKDN